MVKFNIIEDIIKETDAPRLVEKQGNTIIEDDYMIYIQRDLVKSVPRLYQKEANKMKPYFTFSVIANVNKIEAKFGEKKWLKYIEQLLKESNIELIIINPITRTIVHRMINKAIFIEEALFQYNNEQMKIMGKKSFQNHNIKLK